MSNLLVDISAENTLQYTTTTTHSSVTTERSQAAAAAAPGVPETDGGEVGAAPKTAAPIPPCRRGPGLGPRRRLSGGGAHSL